MIRPRILVVLPLVLVVACSKPAPEPAPPAAAITSVQPHLFLLERVDDAAVVQVFADGFADLPLRDKVLAWHLYQAAIAGRDIYYDQRYAHGLEMREVIEAVLTHPAGVGADTLGEIQRYAKLFWLNSGPYSNLTSRKFVLRTTPEAFAVAVRNAAAAGADLPLASGETVDQLLARMAPWFFDPDFEPMVTNKAPGPGRDILASSANNLYAGVLMRDLSTFTEKYPLNSRLVKRDGRLVEEVYRVDGRYDPQIRDIVSHLEAALPFATEPSARALRALIQWYRTGEAEDRRAYDVAWVEDKDPLVDTVNGFTEVYLDARGVKGAWEGIVSFIDAQKTEGIRTLAASAQWFEDHMPWAAKYRKPDVQGITANAVDVVIETGEAGPITPIGINLPNDQQVREAHGSKSVSLANVIEAYDQSTDPSFRNEFSWSPEEAARSAKWGSLASSLLTDMHEVIGHASGRLADRLQGRPEAPLREFYSALEEARADLVALYFLPDPKLAELGLVPAADQAEIARTEYESYARNALVQLRRVRTGAELEEDHMRNRQMIVRWLLANTKAIEVRTRDSRTFYVMTDPAAFREGVATLLSEVQRIKSEGDYAAAKRLFETYGIRFDPALRDQIVVRVDRLRLPAYTGFVMPRLQAVIGDDGQISNVKITYPQDLTKQMLEYASLTRATRQALLEAARVTGR